MNKVELLRRLNSINSEINDIYRREMLQEGKMEAIKIFFTKGWQVLKGTVGKHPEAVIQLEKKIAAGSKGLGQIEKALAGIAAKYGKNSVTYKAAAKVALDKINSAQILPQMKAAASQLDSYYNAVKYTKIAGGTTLAVGGTAGTAGGAAYAYNKLSSPPVGEELPSTETIMAATISSSDGANIENNIENLNVLERLWNSIKNMGEKFKMDVEKMISDISNNLNVNPIALSLSGFLLALLLMFAGVVIYYINVGGNMGDSIKQAFQNAIDKVRNSSGTGESIINVVMMPANIALGFISQSPLGSIIFAFGICVFMFMSIITLAGWKAINNPDAAQDAPEGEASAPAETPAYISNIW